MIDWNLSAEDRPIMNKIAERAVEMLKAQGVMPQPLSHYAMDVTAVHLNIQPLRLADLLAADDFNFGHDVFGIGRHLNRDPENLKLLHCFLPRFSKHEEVAA